MFVFSQKIRATGKTNFNQFYNETIDLALILNFEKEK